VQGLFLDTAARTILSLMSSGIRAGMKPQSHAEWLRVTGPQTPRQPDQEPA